MNFTAASAGELFKKGALLAGKMHGENHYDTRIEVAATLAAQVRHALAPQAENSSVLCLRRNLQRQLATIRHGYSDLTAENGRDQINIDVGIEIIALAFVERVWFDGDDEVKIAARPAVVAGLAFTGHTDAGAVIHAGRYLDLDALILR